jgi:hypothetical protein
VNDNLTPLLKEIHENQVDDDTSPMLIDELEVVTEDLLEDRHSLISSAKSLAKPLST